MVLPQIQSNMEKKRVSASSSEVAAIADKQAVLDALHAKAMTMFKELDTDGNGVIDRWVARPVGRQQHFAMQRSSTCCCCCVLPTGMFSAVMVYEEVVLLLFLLALASPGLLLLVQGELLVVP